MPPQRPERGDPALGLRLRELRLERGMTMAALAERIGVTQPAISQWESGRERPGRETLQRLAGALGVTAEALALRAGAQSATATLSPLQLPADVPVLGTAVGGGA